MSWRPKMEGLLFAAPLLVTLLAVAIKTLTPVTASNDSIADRPTVVRAYPGLTTSWEFESPWDKGALWDDQAPAYDLSQSDR